MRVGPERVRRRDGLTEWSQDDPQRRHRASRADLVPGQALPDRRDDDERCHQRQPEHRVRTHQQLEPWLAGRRVRQQQGTRRSRHHGRHNRHQPTAERRVFPHLVRGQDEEGDCDRRDEPGRGSGQPQQPVERERGVQTDPVRAHEQRSGSEREQRHRRCAVEMRHDRIVSMTAGGRGMPSPMHRRGDAHDDEQGRGQRPHGSRERPQPGYVDRQSRGRHCHDPGAHHRRYQFGVIAANARVGCGRSRNMPRSVCIANAVMAPTVPPRRPGGYGPRRCGDTNQTCVWPMWPSHGRSLNRVAKLGATR